jgi:hypothetical protein
MVEERCALAAQLNVAARKGLGDKVRLVARVELVAKIFDVALDGPGRDPELLRALLRGEAAGDALEHLALALGQGDEVFLLPRKIHHRSPSWAIFTRYALIPLVIGALQELERHCVEFGQSRSKISRTDLSLGRGGTVPVPLRKAGGVRFSALLTVQSELLLSRVFSFSWLHLADHPTYCPDVGQIVG